MTFTYTLEDLQECYCSHQHREHLMSPLSALVNGGPENARYPCQKCHCECFEVTNQARLI